MNTVLVAGTSAAILGLVGYTAGIFVAYPARAFSLTLLMFGVALSLVGRAGAGEAV